MCDVRPFCGLRYSLQRIADPSIAITPPYDVISLEERSLYYHVSPYNIIRLEYGEESPGDSPDNNKYTRAAATLDDWLHEEVLIRERQPAFYIIEHCFPYQDSEKRRTGLIARVKLEEFDGGHIHPHEKTNKAPAIDRLHLLRSCNTNISPIMGLVNTDHGEMSAILHELSSGEPDMSATDNYGVKYNLWAAVDETAIDKITDLLSSRDIVIADGHHRYETALRYRKEQQVANPAHTGDELYNFVMMSLMDTHDPDLVMLPTHRLVRGLEQQVILHMKETISPYFDVEELLPPASTIYDTIQSWLQTLEGRGQKGAVLGMYGLHGEKLCVLRLRPDADLLSLMTEDELGLWKDLDVVLLQRVIMQSALGIRTLEEETSHLDYNRDGVEIKSRVDSGKHQLAFFLNPAPVSGIMNTAVAGKRLPQKSTYFYPKTPAGLVLNPLWD
jgi:uncharacterized protein (DUF1015 family)